MAGTAPISAMQQALLGKKIWVETYQSTGVFRGLEEVITDKNKKIPTEGKPIVIRRDLKEYKGSLSQTVFMLGKLTGEGIEGDDTLKGHEQPLDKYSQTVSVKQLRHAVCNTGAESDMSSPIKLFPQFKPALAEWYRDRKAKAYLRKLAGATSKVFSNTPTAATSNRLVYGSGATSTATITSSSLLTVNLVKKCVTLAENEYLTGTDGNYIPPIAKIKTGKGAFFLLLVHPDVYDDFWASAEVKQIARESASYQKDNPLMNAGDIVIADTIIRRCEYLREANVGEFSTWGSGGATEGATNLFLGSAALAVSECDSPGYVPDTDDYGNIKGMAIRNIWGCQKALMNGQDLGVIAVKTYRSGL